MDQKIQNFIRETYALKAIIRFPERLNAIRESVAEHSYFVTLITLKLSEYYKFDLQHALEMALVHDLPEIYIGDISTETKKRFPGLHEMLDTCALYAMNTEQSPRYGSLLLEFEAAITIEAKIVKLADSISVFQYANAEMEVSDSRYMHDVHNNSLKKIIKIEKELEGVRK